METGRLFKSHCAGQLAFSVLLLAKRAFSSALSSIFAKRTARKKIIARHSVPEAFYLAAKRLNASTDSLCLHTDEHTRSGLIALEASLRRVFFPNFVTAAVICSRLFVHSLHRFACRLPPTFDFVSSSYDLESPQVRLHTHTCPKTYVHRPPHVMLVKSRKDK